MATMRSVAVRSVDPESTPDIDAWAETRAGLLAFVTRRVESPEAAEDIVQDVLERMQRADPATITHVSAWLYRAARNAIVDHYRSRRPTLSLDDRPETGDHGDLGHESTEPAAVVQELARCLRPLIEELPADHRSAVTLVDLDGLTHATAARLAGISTSGMKSRVQRGRRRLAALLQECCAIETTPSGTITGYDPRAGPCRC